MGNQELRYRPLLCGTLIFNPKVRRHGTLGLFGTSDGHDLWVISTAHVLLPANPTAADDGDPIFQPFDDGPANQIARTSLAHFNQASDFAAAEIELGIEVENSLLGLGPLGVPMAPRTGLRVVKSGTATGVTEGVVDGTDGGSVTIVPPEEYPVSYTLSDRGDSGSIWVSQASFRPVALHQIGNVTGPEVATAVSILDVLAGLGLDSIA